MRTHFKLAAGRLLKVAPDWPCSDARVVFDRYSGDYWVVASLAARVLENLQDGHEATFEQLKQAHLVETGSSAQWQEALKLTLHSLVETGLLVDTRRPDSAAVLDDCITS